MKRAIRSFSLLLLLPGVLLLPSIAWGQEGSDEANYTPPLERRSGFTMGVSYGLGMGSFVGYPNEVEKMNNPEYRVATGTTLSSGFSIWLGGALRDWFTFGAGMFSTGGGSDDATGGGAGFGVHIETFPLYPVGGLWRDLALATEFGAGSGKLDNKAGGEDGEGGNMSLVSAGLIFEPWQFWHMSHGPSLMVRYQFSDSMTASAVLLGWRMAFYWTQKG